MNDPASKPGDLAALRERFPAWTFEAHWLTVASGPDKRHILAHRGTRTLSGWDAEALAEAIAREEQP